jgi:hypothetical protein
MRGVFLQDAPPGTLSAARGLRLLRLSPAGATLALRV